MLEKVFKLRENHTTVKTEILAGITTFMTMAYILAVNPNVLSASGMDRGAVFTATVLASFLGTACMALFANYPFALAPGMGLNAYFAYTVVIGMGYPWQSALAAGFVEGVIGLQNAKIVVGGATLVELFSLDAVEGATMQDAGICVILALIGVFLTAILVIKNVKGNILWGILGTWILGIICQFTGLYVPNPEIGYYSLLPDFSAGISVPSLAPIFMKLDFRSIPVAEFIVVVCAFLFVDMFDTLGTLIGVATKADMLDGEGKLPNIKGALLADAVATTAGAVLGTSTTTTFVESASGVTEGGRTGLTSITTAVLFLLALLFSPIFLAIPSFATAPALIIVGFYMVNQVGLIDFSDFSEGIPAFICIGAMPFFYSISEGISMGVISYVVLNLLTGKAREKKISPVMYILAVLFLVKYFLI